MIVRTWRGAATARPLGDAYVRHLEHTVFPRLRGLPGHLGAYLLRRELGDRQEFLVLTLWESMEAVRRFAGDQPELAVVEPEARAVLSELDPTVGHYEAVLAPTVASPG